MTNTNEMITPEMINAHLSEKYGVEEVHQVATEDLSADPIIDDQTQTESAAHEENSARTQENTQAAAIKITPAFTDVIPSESQSQQHFDPSSIDRLVEEKVNETLRNIAQQNNGQQATEEQKIDVQEVIRREITQAIRAERQTVQNQQIINQYKNHLNENLKTQGIEIEKDPILAEWSDRKLIDSINYIEQQYGRRINSNELKEVVNFHSEQLEAKLNIRKGRIVPENNQQTVTPITNATTVTNSNKPVTTSEKLTSDYSNLAKRQNNELSPSQAVAYQKKLMKLQGTTKMRF